MKNLRYLLLLALLAACKNSDTVTPGNGGTGTNTSTIVEYKYTSGTSSSYQLTYTDANGSPTTTTFTGKTFDKIVTTNQASGFKNANFTINNTISPTPNVPGAVNILVNGKVVVDNTPTFMPGQATFSYSAVVFQ